MIVKRVIEDNSAPLKVYTGTIIPTIQSPLFTYGKLSGIQLAIQKLTYICNTVHIAFSHQSFFGGIFDEVVIDMEDVYKRQGLKLPQPWFGRSWLLSIFYATFSAACLDRSSQLFV